MPTFDPNVMRSLRLGNIFQAQSPEMQMPSAPVDDGSMSFATPQKDQSFDLESYQPKTEMSDKMTGMINHMPDRESPSLGRRIGGILAMLSGGGMGAYNHITQKPYEDKMSTFKDQFDPTAKAAQIEGTQNTNMRMLANQVATDRRGRETIDLNAKKVDAKIDNDTKRTAIAEARAKAYTYKQSHPDHKMVVDKDGIVYFVNPQNPTEKVNTGLNSGDLDDYDKIMLAHENKMGEIHASGNEARSTEGVRQGGRETLKEAGNWDVVNVVGENGKTKSYRMNKATGEMSPVKVSGQVVKPGTDKTGAAASSGRNAKGETPQEFKVRVFNEAQKTAREHPEWAKFIKAKPDGTVIITKPAGKTGVVGSLFGGGGPDEKTYRDIVAKIGIDPKTGSTEDKVTANSSSDDRVTISKDGKTVGTIPRTQIDQAKSQGYTVN